MGKKKPYFVGLRMTDTDNEMLSHAQEKFNMSKTDVLLKGLDLVSDYYSLGLDKGPLAKELENLEHEAKLYAENLKRVRTRSTAIKDMVGELHEVDEVVDRYENRESALIQILLTIQEKNRWLPKHALIWISERLHIPIARIYQIANFYEAFSLEPRGAHMVQVCMGTACYVRGAPQLLLRIEEALKIKPDETDAEQNFTLKTVHCLGCCALGPVVKVDDEYYSDPGTKKLEKIFSECVEAVEVKAGS